MPAAAATNIAANIVWDAHSCLPLLSGIDMSVLRRHRAAGFDYVSINVGMDMNPIDQVLKTIAWFRQWLSRHADEFVQVRTLDDIAAAKAAGKLAVAFDLEGSTMLLEDSAMVAFYGDLGVKQMHLVYNRNNSVGGGCHDDDTGLTAYGREVVRAGADLLRFDDHRNRTGGELLHERDHRVHEDRRQGLHAFHGNAAGDLFQEGVIDVPVRGEEVDVQKTARKTGEVRVEKEAVQRDKTVSGTVRREEVHVDDATVSDENMTSQDLKRRKSA